MGRIALGWMNGRTNEWVRHTRSSADQPTISLAVGLSPAHLQLPVTIRLSIRQPAHLQLPVTIRLSIRQPALCPTTTCPLAMEGWVGGWVRISERTNGWMGGRVIGSTADSGPPPVVQTADSGPPLLYRQPTAVPPCCTDSCMTSDKTHL
eukprot:289409-Chlamydomonas_euryale.AAC.1